MQLLKETRLIEVKTSRRNSLHKIVFCYHSPYLYFLRLKQLLLPFWFLSNLHYNKNSKWIRGVAFHVHGGNESILVIQWQSCLGWETWLFCCQGLAQKIIKWLAYQPMWLEPALWDLEFSIDKSFFFHASWESYICSRLCSLYLFTVKKKV